MAKINVMFQTTNQIDFPFGSAFDPPKNDDIFFVATATESPEFPHAALASMKARMARLSMLDA